MSTDRLNDQERFARVVNDVQALFVAYLKRLGEVEAEDGLGRYLLGDIAVEADVAIGERARVTCYAVDHTGCRHRLFEILGAPGAPANAGAH